jgi:hypothetical protein
MMVSPLARWPVARLPVKKHKKDRILFSNGLNGLNGQTGKPNIAPCSYKSAGTLIPVLCGNGTMDILFIGNSHVYMHFMPLMLEELVKASDLGVSLVSEQCTGEGVSLQWHWKNQDTRDMIVSGNWDFVVLQDRAGGPLEERKSFEKHARLLNQEIIAHGAQAVFYMTWALKSKSETRAELAEAYSHIAAELGANLAPVGLAWDKAHRSDPDIDLFHPDGRHANPLGAYLTACVFYSVILGESPEGLPGRLFIKGKNRVDLDKDQARFLQKIAFEIV